MKRFLGILLIALGLIGLFAQPVRALDTNNFRITSYVVDMKLGRNSDNRSTLLTKETIIAQFPDYDQNHGLERVLVLDYNKHTTKLAITSVTDAGNTPLPYSITNGVMRIGSADTYVHGSKTYVITYTQQDVTRFYADTDRDEFYWDVIGGNWQVPIDSAAVHLTVDNTLRAALSGNAACYKGAYNSTTSCSVNETESGYMATASGLQAGQGVTVAIGFHKGTFVDYAPSLFDRVKTVWLVLQFIGFLLLFPLIPILALRQQRRMNRKKELDVAPVEYLPPGDASVLTSAKLLQGAKGAMTAQLLDLAVRHYVQIRELSPKSLFKPADYDIKIVKDVSGLRWEEQEYLRDAFKMLPPVGESLKLSALRKDTTYGMRTAATDKALTKRIRGEYGLRALDTAEQKRLRLGALILFGIGVVTLSPVLWWILAAVLFGLSFACWRLTDKGLALRRYLDGLQEYVKMAEVDRIKLLQSPEGAEKVAEVVDGADTAQRITLYERVLPYAVLFGLEKQWNAQLGQYYETTGTQPEWYAGQSGVFNAAIFSAAMSDFSSAGNYASSSSADSGGSGGGGFSGGGGGGGGGGGW